MSGREIIIGTTNEAKIKQIKGALSSLDLVINGVVNKSLLPYVEENFQTAQENARAKATSYAKALRRPVLSMDNALYIEGLAQENQPGIHVRRINGRNDRPSDEELLVYYSELINGLGGKVDGHWEFAVCIATPSGETKEITIVSPRVFVGRPSGKVLLGYPLESIQIDPESGRYISEMSQEEQDLFWQRAIGRQLCDFVKTFTNTL